MPSKGDLPYKLLASSHSESPACRIAIVRSADPCRSKPYQLMVLRKSLRIRNRKPNKLNVNNSINLLVYFLHQRPLALSAIGNFRQVCPH